MNHAEFKKRHTAFLKTCQDKHFKWFEKIMGERPRTKWALSIMPSLNGKQVLDLLGGYGVFGAYLQAVKGMDFDYTCLDFNEYRIKCGPKYFKTFGLISPKFVLHDARFPFPFPSEAFDVVWLFGWCDVTLDSFKVFCEVFRILKSCGVFMFNIAKIGAPSYYKIRLDERELLKLLKKTGFEAQRIDILNGIDRGVVAQKCGQY